MEYAKEGARKSRKGGARPVGMGIAAALLMAACAPAAPPVASLPTVVPFPTPTSVPAPGTAARPSAPSAPSASGRAQATPTVAPSPTAVPGGQVRRGGTLVQYQEGDPRKLDPNQGTSAAFIALTGNIFSPLVRFDPAKFPERVLIGDLATSWEARNSGREWTFKLRQGVKFHDGAPFTSRDVKATVERIRDHPAGIASPFAPQYAAISQVETPDDYTAVVKASAPLPWFLDTLASAGTGGIVPAHIVGKDQRALEKKPIGTGPFRLSDWNPTSFIKMARNDSYYVPGKPYVDGFTVVFIPEPATQLAAVRTARVHMTGYGTRGVSYAEAKILRQVLPDTQITQYISNAQMYLWLNMRRAPFSDVRVRKAALLAIDQQSVVDTVYEGNGFVVDFSGKVGLQWSLSPEEAARLMPGTKRLSDADRAKARELLKEAGYGQGAEIEFMLSPRYQDLSLVVADQLSRAGFRPKTKSKGYGTEWTNEAVAGRYDAGVAAQVYGPYHPLFFFSWFASDFEWNYTGIKDATFDEMVNQLQLLTDPARVKELSDTMQRRLAGLVPVVPVGKDYIIMAARPEVKGWNGPGPLLRDNVYVGDVWLAR